MDARFKALLDDAAWAAKKVQAVISAVNGSPITVEAEKLVPGLTGLVGKLAGIEAVAAGASTALPAIEAAITIYEALGGRPNQDLDNVGPGRSEMRDG